MNNQLMWNSTWNLILQECANHRSGEQERPIGRTCEPTIRRKRTPDRENMWSGEHANHRSGEHANHRSGEHANHRSGEHATTDRWFKNHWSAVQELLILWRTPHFEVSRWRKKALDTNQIKSNQIFSGAWYQKIHVQHPEKLKNKTKRALKRIDIK